MRITIYIFAYLVSFIAPVFATNYYVKEGGKDANNGLSYSTAKATLNSVISAYALKGGDVIYLDGTISHSSTPLFKSSDQGSVRHSFETVNSLSGSTVTFSTTPSGVSTTTDYVCIYNSFKGNAGAFKVTAVNGSQITVDTSDLPGGTFNAETSSPWTLKGAIITPLRITAYDQGDQPTIQNSNDGLKFNNADCILVDHITIYNNSRYEVFVDGGSDYAIFDHVTMYHNNFNCFTIRHENIKDDANYMILQHSDLSDTGNIDSSSMGAVIYAGHANDDVYHQDYQIYAYNYIHLDVGGSANASQLGTGYNGKINADYVIIWGNHFYGWNSKYKNGYGAIKIGKGPHVVANNYIEDWGGTSNLGGIVFMAGMASSDPKYVFNNVLTGVTAQGNRGAIYVEGGTNANAYVHNNVIYDSKNNMPALDVDGWGSAGTLGHFYNNIIHTAKVGLSNGSGGSGGTIKNHDHNFIYNCTTPFSKLSQQSYEYTTNPGLTDPINQDFSLHSSSDAINKGIDLSSIFSIDFQYAKRDSLWDIGAYEFSETTSVDIPAPPTNLRIVAN